MAQVATGQRTAALDLAARIDRELDYQLQAWRGIPERETWWSEMDAADKEAFQLEWTGITESRLHDLETWAGSGNLTPSQNARYAKLRALIADQRPALDRLFAS